MSFYDKQSAMHNVMQSTLQLAIKYWQKVPSSGGIVEIQNMDIHNFLTDLKNLWHSKTHHFNVPHQILYHSILQRQSTMQLKFQMERWMDGGTNIANAVYHPLT